MLFAFALLLARFVHLQVVQHDTYASKAEENRISLVPIAPNRGLILDRNGVVLARNYSAYTLEIFPAKVKDVERTIQELSEVVEVQAKDRSRFRKLYAEVRKKHPKVGYATVYRTLRLLVESGLAHSRQFDDGQTRYEVTAAHHDHLICVQCHMILEFDNEEIERLQDEVADRLGGFRVLRHKHELYCVCPKYAGVPGGKCPNERA